MIVRKKEQMHQLNPILAFSDNYIWCLRDKNNYCVIVDPGTADPVIDYLQRNNLTLAAILITHHHLDHTGGISKLLRFSQVALYGSNQTPQVTDVVEEDQEITISPMSLTFTVLKIPGHTLDHVAYYTKGLAFTGDTLFTAGCGKIFEGSAAQMYHSLQKLNNLPLETLIYCGHEYTEKNLQFAEMVEPNNKDIQTRLQETHLLRQKNKPTVPASLSIEKNTNPFLRCEEPAVIAAASTYAKRSLQDPIEVLETLREWKNNIA